MRQGDYSRYFAAVGQPNKTLTDPVTGQAFPGNVIPSARLNPVAMKIVQGYIPAANITTGNPEVPFRNGQATADSANSSTWSTIVARLDQKVTSRNTAGFSYNQNPLQATVAEPVPALGTSSRIGGSKQYNWTDTHIVSSTIVNEARVSFFNFDNSRYGNSGQPQSSFTDAVGMDLGADAASRKSYRQLPRISVTGFIYGDGGTVGSTYVDDSRRQRWLHFRDNLSVQYRKHTFKFGYDHRFKRDARLPSSASIGSQQTYNGQYTGEAFADFLLGLPQGTSRFTAGVPLLDRRYNELGVFAQDSYKASQRLTLTFGLRLDRLSPRTEVHGAFDNFDPGTGAIVVPDQQALSLIHPAFPKSIPIKTAAQAGFSRTLLNPARTLAPRIGFAYRASKRGNLVVRGGWGMYSVDAGSSLNNFRLFDSGPFSLTETFLNPGKLTGAAPLVTLDHPFPSTLGTVPSSVSGGRRSARHRHSGDPAIQPDGGTAIGGKVGGQARLCWFAIHAGLVHGGHESSAGQPDAVRAGPQTLSPLPVHLLV
jgi:hypothetical protein